MNENDLEFYDFSLPDNLIAQFPVEPRDSSKLLVFRDDKIYDHNFFELPSLLPRDSVLIFNDTKVIKARLEFEVNGRKSEIFFVEQVGKNEYEILCKPKQLFKHGSIVNLPGMFRCVVVSARSDGTKIIRIDDESFNYVEYLDKYGSVPLPPYIHSSDANKLYDKYQTVYANEGASVAAPTAGLHFTKQLLENLKNDGIQIEFVSLQVGLGTFLPIRVENLTDHKMHTEHYYISPETARNLNLAKKAGKNIISVGTTTLRAIQSSLHNGEVRSGLFNTDIFIKPGYSYWWIDALITNFHLPQSTLFILVSAFVGIQNARKIYSHAINRMYRFFSFGDSSLLWLNTNLANIEEDLTI